MTPTFALGAAANYAVLFEGGGGSTLQINNITTNVIGSAPSQGNGVGNIGVGGTGQAVISGSIVNGSLDFAATNTGQLTSTGNLFTGGVNFGFPAVTSAIDTVNALNATLGALPGTNVAISGNTTLNASDGVFSPSGLGYTNVRVFTVTSFKLNNGQDLIINGDANGDSVVVNFPTSLGDINFNGSVILNGISTDNVILNFIGGNALALTINNNNLNGPVDTGIYLHPNGTINVSPDTNLVGRLFGGDSQSFQFAGPSFITAPFASKADPTLFTVPTPGGTLGTNPVTLRDTALLEGGFNPTGTITFTLVYNGMAVDTEILSVVGNGAYVTPGFTLPVTGTVTGPYQWDVFYSGDANNNTAIDQGGLTEGTVVHPASPTISTTPIPAIVTLDENSSTLFDTAVLANGYHPTGSITFTLFQGVTPVHSETVAVNGNGTYLTSTGFTLPTTGAVTGAYLWTATYNGDGNNNIASGSNESVIVIAARPGLATVPAPKMVTLDATPVTLNDAANLIFGYNPTGTINFMLFQGAALVDTETVTVNHGNGIYTTPTGFTLPNTGTVTGMYHWTAMYSGDANNNSAIDNNSDFPEGVTVNPASPTIITIPTPIIVTLDANFVVLRDTAILANGFNPTGTITFTLFKGGTLLDTETVAVSGNGTYTTPIGFLLSSSGTGTYQWTATYSGDANNNPDIDINEQVTVIAARPALITIPTPTTVVLDTNSVLLKDTAILLGGFHPTGNITFELFLGGTLLDVEVVTVNGNGAYTTPTGFTLPSSAMAGILHWDVTYSGDANNSPASEVNEQVVVSAITSEDMLLSSALTRYFTLFQAILSGGVILPPPPTGGSFPVFRALGESASFPTTPLSFLPGINIVEGTDIGEILGLVFDDLNANARQDYEEPGLPQRIMILETEAGNAVQVAVTDRFGRYFFTEVKPGTYHVQVVLEEDEAETTPTDWWIRLQLGERAVAPKIGVYYEEGSDDE